MRINIVSILDYFENIKYVLEFIKLLGKHGDNNCGFIKPSAKEENWPEILLQDGEEGKEFKEGIGDAKSIGFSQVRVNDKGHIFIIGGSLKGLKGQIRRIDLHKRIAEVEVSFMNATVMIHLGIEIC